jgi:DNA-binding beta-propeller fold protein YncE
MCCTVFVLGMMAAAGAQAPGSSSIVLPGGPPVGMDYLAFDAASGLLFVPASNTGKLDVIDTKTGGVKAVDGWPTARQGERIAGITAAGVGGGYVYVGNRADSSVCAVEIASLTRRGCVVLPSMPDGVFYVGATHEVWVTTPRDNSLQILGLRDPATPVAAGAIKLDGQPEGYGVDERRGVVFTNLEDKDRTLVIDAHSRKVTSSWRPECGEKGPRGIAVDPEQMHVFVACAAEGLREFNSEGKILARLATGAGVDNIDWFASARLVYVASAQEGKLTIAKAAADGALSVVSTTKTVEGARSVLVDKAGKAYLPDSKGGRLIVVRPGL